MRSAPPSRLPVVLLAAGLVLVLALAWQAWDAARSHRASVEGMLHDYAALAGSEMVRRSAAGLGYARYYPAVSVLGRAAAARGGALPGREEMAATLDPAVLETVAWLFRRDPSGELTYAGGRPPAGLEETVADALAGAGRTSAGGRAFAFLHLPAPALPGGVLTLVHAEAGDGGRVGFAVDAGGYATLFRAVLDDEPLLPPSVGAGEVGNEMLCVEVVAPDGAVRFRSGDDCGRERPGRWAEVAFGAAYEGILDGFTVRAAVVPAAVPRLVVGGLPGRRLPGLAGLLLLTVGVMTVAALQLRRERQLARLRSDFVSRVSHELRTPLTQIRLFSETLLLERARGADERRRALTVIDREARRLGHLVDNVLQFSRSERGGLRLAAHRLDLSPLVREVVDEFRPLAAGAGCRLSCEAEPGVGARGDADAVRQVLLNLLDNAVKYGPPGQRVRVGAAAAGGVARLWVEDEGPGVPEDEREAVFRRFHRLRRETARAVAGTGIGLAVVRDLAERQGGRAWVEAAAGGGARFVVELPGEEP